MRIVLFIVSACLIVGGLGTCLYKLAERNRKLSRAGTHIHVPGAKATVSFPGYDEVYRLVIGIGVMSASAGVAVGFFAFFVPRFAQTVAIKSDNTGPSKLSKKKRRRKRPHGPQDWFSDN